MGTYASYPTTSVNEYNAIAAKAKKYAGFLTKTMIVTI